MFGSDNIHRTIDNSRRGGLNLPYGFLLGRGYTFIIVFLCFFCLGMQPAPEPEPAPDTTPPKVSITAPLSNATVLGTVNVQAQATDNAGVAKVEFYIDDILKSTSTKTPYAYSWNTASFSEGDHTLKVIAYNTGAKSAQTKINVKVDNASRHPIPLPPTPTPTPPTPAPVSPGELNIISAAASSTYSSAYLAAKVIDNKNSTSWRGKGSIWSRPAYWWLVLDLGKVYSLAKFTVLWDKTYGSTNYAIQGSSDNKTWVSLQAGLSSAGATIKEHALTGAYRYIRVYINRAARYYPIIYEAKLYGSPPDTTAPTGSIKINNGAQYANSGTVSLNLSAQDNTGGSGLAQMRFSNDGANWSAAENYSAAKTWTLSPGDGQKTVYVKFSDLAGNLSQPYTSNITLDTTPPALTVNPVHSPTNQNVMIGYVVGDNLTPSNQIVLTGNNSPYINDGSYNVTLTAKDAAGNISTASVGFTIDKTPPVVVITSPENGAVLEEEQVQLQGTVDGAAFSESRSLSDGQNTLTKTATDAAGNTASASVTVTYYTGTLIGPEGGEVTSADGRVKVIFPPGALNAPTRIYLSVPDKNTLKAVLPPGKTVLIVAKCKPNINFNKPVTLVYTLEQAQVPGTPVALGIFEESDTDNQGNKDQNMYLTGDLSFVPEDGVTLTFKIGHFSTYAALQGLISQGAPIGGGVQIPLPDLFTGAFGHSVPITVPPGRKGMQPNLALTYRSSNPNSWTGVGFSLNPGYIVRSTRLDLPHYTDNDTFYLVTDAGTTEFTRLTDNLYQAKIESAFTKFYKQNDDSWMAVAKDGSKLFFGESTDSREVSPSGTFAWYLTRALDTNGNYIQYSYTKDQGKSYLFRIEYTGNQMGVLPANSVEFFLEGRQDIPSSYISGSKITTAKRLRQIQVKAGSELAWRYELKYGVSPDTNRSLLESVKQLGSDDKSMPAQSFEYQQVK